MRGAVDEPDGEKQPDVVGQEVAEDQSQAEERPDVQHPGLADVVDPLSEERPGDERPDDEDASRQAGHRRRRAEAVGGDFRHDDHE